MFSTDSNICQLFHWWLSPIIKKSDLWQHSFWWALWGRSWEENIQLNKMGKSACGRHSKVKTGSYQHPWKVYNQHIIPLYNQHYTYGARTSRITLLEKKQRIMQWVMKWKMVALTDRKRAAWIREQKGAADILVAIKRKTWCSAGRVMHRADNPQSTKTPKWMPRKENSAKGSRGLAGVVGTFTGIW